MKLKIALLIGVVILSCLRIQTVYAQDKDALSRYTQSIYSDESKIPVSQVKSIVQTADGFLYFAGYQGLMRYDGIDTKLFTPEEGFPSFNVNFLFEDSKQRLWIATNDAGLVLYDAGEFSVYGLNEGLPALSVRDIAEDETGAVYAATGKGLVLLAEKGTAEVLVEGLVVHIERLKDNELVALLGTGDIVRIAKGKVVRTYESGYFGAEQIISLYATPTGPVYMGSFTDEIYVTDAYLTKTKTLTLPDCENINNFYESKAGKVWVVADNGIAYVENNQVVAVDGLAMDNSLECLYEDHEGNIWIASSRMGLLQLTPSRFTNLSFAAGLPDVVINTTAVYGGDVYIGTDVGLIILRGTEKVENELSKMLANIRIRDLFVDSKGDLWVCTYEQYGVIHFKQNGEIISITRELASDKVRCIIELANGDMAVGSGGGVSIVRDDKVIKNYTADEGIVNTVILSLCEDAEGTLYAGSDGGGIYTIGEGRMQTFDEKDGLASGIILRMTRAAGKMYISTGNALFVKDEEGIQRVDPLIGYDSNIFDIKEVGKELWFLGAKGITIWNSETNDIAELGRRDGLTAGITANSWNYMDSAGVLYLSTSRQVFSISTQDRAGKGAESTAVISHLKADEQVVLPHEGIVTLPKDTRRLDIGIALLSYFSESGQLYYYLEGFDEDIKTAARQDLSLISYTNLKGGQYTFKLYGINAVGEKSEEVSLKIIKHYTFLETSIGRFILTASLIALVFLMAWQILLYQKKEMLARQKAYKDMTMGVMLSIAQVLDAKNVYGKGYTVNVVKYAGLIGKKLGFGESELETLQYAAILHDIGKIGLPDELLAKSEPFTDEDFERVKVHTQIGGDILEEADILKELSLVARYHHERPDGKGYYGLKGEEIPLFARIINICSAYVAMSADGAYKKALTKDKIRMELMQHAGTQFDINIAYIMLEIMDEEALGEEL